MDDLKATANNPRVAKYLPDLFRAGIRGDIEVLGFQAQKQITNSASYQISLVAGRIEVIQYIKCILADVFTGNPVFFTTVNFLPEVA